MRFNRFAAGWSTFARAYQVPWLMRILPSDSSQPILLHPGGARFCSWWEKGNRAKTSLISWESAQKPPNRTGQESCRNSTFTRPPAWFAIFFAVASTTVIYAVSLHDALPEPLL